jgi:hypothetical protein
MGYIDPVQLMDDPRYSEKNSLFLEMLLPGLKPRSPQNMREFFTPYERSVMKLWLIMPGPDAVPWKERLDSSRLGAIRPDWPIRRADQFGLQGWGENFDKLPQRRPCASLGSENPPCGKPSTPEDIWRPITPNGPPSVMICDADLLEDQDAKIVAMPHTEREAYFANSKNWAGKRRAFCRHKMLYEPLNASIELRYPRRFLKDWKEIEGGVSHLLGGFVAAQQPSVLRS